MPLEKLLDLSSAQPEPSELYKDIEFPDPPQDRPYVFINMVSTADGKIVIGAKGGTAAGVGGPTDQLLFRRLQKNADAAIIGSGTLRASTVIYPPEIYRFVVTNSAVLPLQNRFFTDAPEKAFVFAPNSLAMQKQEQIRATANLVLLGQGAVDLKAVMQFIRSNLGIKYLLCEGGSDLNGRMIESHLADELFLTLAPKIKGGTNLPNIVGASGFPPGITSPLKLRSLYRDEDEIYLRYQFIDTL